MDFGIMGLDNQEAFSSNNEATNNNMKQKLYGSGYLKEQQQQHERPTTIQDDKDNVNGVFKMVKRSNNEGHQQQQMLSFSSPNNNTLSPYYYQTSSNPFTRNTSGVGVGGGMMMMSSGSSVRGPFTPSQWMELEHQALIYKYITANVPVPTYLLNPIRKALESAGFSACFSGLRSSNPLGWGGFHLGFSNTDPEPGRCRRTDGKKWRCSRDAVPDQKYCERHINRGRHRSRKPVEAQSGHSASQNTTTTKPKPNPTATVVPASGVSNSLGLSHHPKFQPGGSKIINKENANGAYQQTTTLLSMASSSTVSPNDHHNPYEESSSRSEFGLVCSDSLLNPLNTSLMNFKNYDHHHSDHNSLNNHDQIKSQHALRQFMDDWPKNQPDPYLSISTPLATSNEKLGTTTSPLRLPRELEMGLGVGTIVDSEQSQTQQTNWVPISWEPSTGGPLGEVLHNTSNNNSTGECNNAKALNLMERWDNNSPHLASSPTGVLQRGAFGGSLSNSSAGSSPRGESSKILDGVSLCNGLVGHGLVSPTIGSFSKF